MITVTTILFLAAALLCLAFNNTRLIGIVGIVILFLIHPMLVTVIHALEGITSHLIPHF